MISVDWMETEVDIYDAFADLTCFLVKILEENQAVTPGMIYHSEVKWLLLVCLESEQL